MRALVYAAGAYALCMGTAEAFAPQVSSPTLCRGPECKAGERAAPASALSMKIDYGAGYDPRNRPSAAVQPQQVESFGGQSTYTAAASFETAYNAPSAPAPRGKIDYGAPYDPTNRPVTAADSAPAAMSQAYSAAAPSAGDTSAVMSRVSDMMGAGSGPAAAPRRKIDYGAPYDPRNRPSAAPSYAPAAASDPVMSSASAGDLMTSAPRRKIDYGAPYDPRNRPVTTASAAPAAADAPAWSAAPAAAAAPAPVGRKIDYGAPYDPRNRGGSDTLARVEATMAHTPLSYVADSLESSYSGAPAPPVRRKIDYGAPGYVPASRR